MNLREAAERTARSVTTLRRYIRSGRLRAEKSHGRYGPEYAVSEEALAQAGLETEPEERALASVSRNTGAGRLEQAFRDSVPLSLFHELQMKHEQLLVQYGMMRVGGLRALELQGKLEEKRRRIEEYGREVDALKVRTSREIAALREQLREAELELEGRHLEICALREKLRGLEMITRRSEGTETLERQFADVMEQIRRVERIRQARRPEPPPRRPWRGQGDEPGH